MKNFVIYSAIVGAYDEIKQPLTVDSRFDYILFTNDIVEDYVGVWQIRRIDYYNEDFTRICRYVKTHSHELLSQYQISIWIDSNIQIIDSYIYEKVMSLFVDNVLISAAKHPERNCVYDEAFVLMLSRFEREKTVVKWCHRLRHERYPKNNGLNETGLLYRKNCSAISQFNERWWECINSYSKRDQLSFNYCLWDRGLVIRDFLEEGDSLRFSQKKHIKHEEHTSCANRKCLIWNKSEAWLLRSYLKRYYSWIPSVYYHIYRCPFPMVLLFCIGQLTRFYDRMTTIIKPVKR